MSDIREEVFTADMVDEKGNVVEFIKSCCKDKPKGSCCKDKPKVESSCCQNDAPKTCGCGHNH